MSALDVKKHGGLDRSWRLSCRALLSVFLLDERGHDIQGGSRGHPILLPALDGATTNTARIGKLLSAPPEPGADGLDAWSVVHDLVAVVKDDGLAVTAGWMIGGDSHGLLLLKGNHFRVGAAVQDIGKSVGIFERVRENLVNLLVHVFRLDHLKLRSEAENLSGPQAMATFEGKPNTMTLAPKHLDRWSAKLAHLFGDLGKVGFVVVGVKKNDCHGGQWLRARDYAALRKTQELFTQTCVFFQRAVFRPLNDQALP